MPTTCNIEFVDNPWCTFYGGQILSAKITFNLDEPKEIKGIALKLQGTADTRWTENSEPYSGSSSKNVTYTGHEDYIDIKTFLLGTADSESITLEAGEHAFSFNYHLPLTCGSSIESRFGKVHYKLKAIMIRPRKLDKTFTKGFTIVKLVDLNRLPTVTSPVFQEAVKQFGQIFWKTPPINMKVSMPQSGFVAGQKIPVSVAIANGSGKTIKQLKVSLIMIATCHSQDPMSNSHDYPTKVSKIKNDTAVSEEKFDATYELPVPPLPPTDDSYTSLVHISYQVKVEAVMPMMQSNLQVNLPVIIGSVPLLSGLQVQYPTTTVVVVPPPYDEHDKAAEAARSSVTTTTLTQTPTTPPWESGASNIPPPTYAEAMFMPHANMGDNESDFVPRYPVFHVPGQTASGKTT